MSSWFI